MARSLNCVPSLEIDFASGILVGYKFPFAQKASPKSLPSKAHSFNMMCDFVLFFCAKAGYDQLVKPYGYFKGRTYTPKWTCHTCRPYAGLITHV